MKKFVFFLAVALMLATGSRAQGINDTRHAIGLRGGWGAELSYQHYIAPETRLEGTIGVNRYGFSFEGMYQVMNDIMIDAPGEMKWYAGVGFGFGNWSNHRFKHGFSAGMLGQAGIEYAFMEAPLMLSFDYRPGLYFTPEFDFDWSGFALGLRFYF